MHIPDLKHLTRAQQLSLAVLLAVGVIVALSLLAFQWGQSTFDQMARESISVHKIGFSSDWEYGSRKKLEHKLPIQAFPELEKVVNYFNQEFQPEFVIGGGDYIESSATKPEKAKEQLRAINEVFQKLTAPRAYALGNHDMRSLTKAEVMEILGMEANHRVIDLGEWRFVIMDTNFNKEDDSHRNADSYVQGYVAAEELQWLEENISTDRPTLVFSHHSPIRTLNQAGGSVQNITNDEAVRTVLERHANVVAVISGHTPNAQQHTVNGIHYFVADTLVNETALGAFAAITLKYSPMLHWAEVDFKHFGMNLHQWVTQSWLEKNAARNQQLQLRYFASHLLK